jgi:hypothetical protein
MVEESYFTKKTYTIVVIFTTFAIITIIISVKTGAAFMSPEVETSSGASKIHWGEPPVLHGIL